MKNVKGYILQLNVKALRGIITVNNMQNDRHRPAYMYGLNNMQNDKRMVWKHCQGTHFFISRRIIANFSHASGLSEKD